MKKTVIAAAIFTIGLGVALLSAVQLRTPDRYDPQIWNPGSIETANRWGEPTFVPLDISVVLEEMDAPESLELGPDGKIYFGTEEGGIWRWAPSSREAEKIGKVNAQPLSVHPSEDGDIWVAATDEGLVGLVSGTSKPALTSADRVPLNFANNIAQLPDGRIIMSQASTRYTMATHNWDIMEAATSGRIILFDPDTKKAEVLVKGVGFANGVEVGGDGAWFLYASSTRHRIDRYWLAGPKAGRSETFLTNLPGFPDNITKDADGLFWVALASPRVSFVDEAMRSENLLRQVLGSMPRAWLPTGDVTWALAVNENAELVHSIRAEGTGFGPITSAYRLDDKLYLGRITGHGIGVIDLSEMEAR